MAVPALFFGGEAAAQAPAPPPPKPAASPPPKTVDEVVVSGAAPDVRTSIDRTSYNIAKDLGAVTGSIADALRNIPSVEVDVQGNISLRGDPNVVIMIDGKPSGMFRGEGRGAALQAMPADQIERVEVITNPTAEFSPEGGAGVINLITRKVRKPGYSGSVRASYGSEGRDNAGLSGAFNSNKLTLSGDATWRSDPQKFFATDARFRLDPASGAILPSLGRVDQRGDGRIVNLRAGVDYDLDAKTRLSAEARTFDILTSVDLYEQFVGRDAGGAPSRVFQRFGRADFDRLNREASGTWRRQFSGQEHQLVVSAGYEVTELDARRDFVLVDVVPEGAEREDDFDQLVTLRQSELKADYSRPMPGEAKLKAGYALQVDANRYDSAATQAAFDNLFKYDQQVHAGYATYEKPLGDWTVLAGLRLEQVLVEMHQVTTRLAAANDDFRAYPSLHVSRQLGDRQRVTVSYSRRIQRPHPQDLNPFILYLSPVDLRSGNPNLKPRETDAFEALWQRRKEGTLYQVTAYYRQSRNEVTDVVRDVGGGVFLTTKENLGESRAAGVELVANGRITRKLTYNASANAYWTEIEAARLGFPETRSGATLGGRATLNWQATSRDFVQLNGFLNGARILPQGRMAPIGVLNIGYRHKFTDNVAVLVTWQDVLDSLSNELVLDTPVLRQRQTFRGNARSAFIGLVWTFGGNGMKPREPGFDFGGGL